MYIKCKTSNNNFLTWYKGDFFNIKEFYPGVAQFQPCETEEEKKIKTNLLYIINKKAIYINFDFENSTFEINKKVFKVTENYEFTFKKTRGNNILAIKGIQGFYNFILESMNIKSSPFAFYTFGMLSKLGAFNFEKSI